MNTKEEIEATRAKLKELEKRAIDEEKSKRWRAVKVGYYCYVNSNGEINTTTDTKNRLDNDRYRSGNYFQTKEEAKNSNIYKVLNSDYDYWFPGFSELPKELPEDCEFFNDGWLKEVAIPNRWGFYNRRWRRK